MGSRLAPHIVRDVGNHRRPPCTSSTSGFRSSKNSTRKRNSSQGAGGSSASSVSGTFTDFCFARCCRVGLTSRSWMRARPRRLLFRASPRQAISSSDFRCAGTSQRTAGSGCRTLSARPPRVRSLVRRLRRYAHAASREWSKCTAVPRRAALRGATIPALRCVCTRNGLCAPTVIWNAPIRKRPGRRVVVEAPDMLAACEGGFIVAGRRDGAVQIAGTNVSCARVAAVLSEHPAVRTCAVRPMRGTRGLAAEGLRRPNRPLRGRRGSSVPARLGAHVFKCAGNAGGYRFWRRSTARFTRQARRLAGTADRPNLIREPNVRSG